MGDKDKMILESLAEAIPHMTEFEKGYLLGVAESKEEKAKSDNKKEAVAACS